MPSYSESVISSARAAKDGSMTAGNAQTVLMCVTMIAILTAVESGLFTSTSSVSGATSANLQTLLETLHTAGYVATVSVTTLTCTWS